MDVDKILQKAVDDTRYEFIGGGYSMLTACPILQVFNIKTLSDALAEGFEDYMRGHKNTNLCVAISKNTNDLLRFQDEILVKGGTNFNGEILTDKKIRIVESQIMENRHNITTLEKMYKHNVLSYRYKIDRSFTFLGMFMTPKHAKAYRDYVSVLKDRLKD